MDKPLLVDTSKLHPLTHEMWDSNCYHCDKRQAKWSLQLEDDPVFICSLCMLYESDWGLAHSADVGQLVKEADAKRNEATATDTKGRILFPKDADRILGTIALISRMYEQRFASEADVVKNIKGALTARD